MGIFVEEGLTGRGKSSPFEGELGFRVPGRGTVGRGEGLRARGSFPSPSSGGDIWGKGSIGDGNTAWGNGVFGTSRGGVGTAWGEDFANDEGGWFVDGEGSLNSTTATPITAKASAVNLISGGILAHNEREERGSAGKFFMV